ncbi:MAG: M48 family metalloprotease [Xanthomonadales bacterium]|nr:M48 family metalloprotease [Xanthomonadales bacterium]
MTLLLLLVCPARSSTEDIKLPDIGTSAGAIVSEQDERRYGEALVRELNRLAHVIDDPLVESYIRHLGFRLAAHSDEPSRNFHFLLIDNKAVNAFAAPGGVIAIHSGLMLLAENEAELAGVVGHEIAHVTQRHLARRMESAQKMSIPMMLLMLGAAVAAGGEGDGVPAAVIGTQGLMQQMMINFTRANEYEADRIGIRTLARAGYDPEGMATFFEKMGRIARNYGGGNIPEFLRTHPVSASRVAEAKIRAGTTQITNNPEWDPDQFYLIRERVRLLTENRPEQLLAHYRERFDTGKANMADTYGLAMAQLNNHDLLNATETLGPLAREHPASLPIQLGMAQIESASGRQDLAKDRLNRALERFPGNLAVSTAKAEILLNHGGKDGAARAEALLRPLLTRYPDNASLFLQYSRAADKTGEWVRAEEAYADHVFLLGRVYDAVTQLEKLLKKPELDYYERSRVNARLDEIRPILAEIQREKGYDPSETRDRPRRSNSAS